MELLVFIVGVIVIILTIKLTKKIICAALIALLIFVFMTSVYGNNNIMEAIVIGDSMEPIYKNEQVVKYLPVSYNMNININDVIIFRIDNTEMIKRIIAMEGDVVSIKNNLLYVNNSLVVEENNIVGKYYVYDKDISINKGEYYVVGDNYSNSIDSRVFGTINRKDIVGLII